jgi:hypothetical protein
MITPIQVTLSITQAFQGAIQDLVDQIEQYIGGSNANQPKHLWFTDDALEVVVTDNVETSGINKDIEYTGTAYFGVGDYVFYPSGDPGTPDEVVVVEAVQDSASLFVADLQNGHYADQSVFKFRWVYQKARLDNIVHTPASTGRARVVLNFTSEGEPLNGTTLPA